MFKRPLEFNITHHFITLLSVTDKMPRSYFEVECVIGVHFALLIVFVTVHHIQENRKISLIL